MMYDKNSHILSVEDVKLFFHHLIDERKVNFHPDDDFADYICYEDKTLTFTPKEVELYNRLMDESFDVCKINEIDIYSIGFDELKRNLMEIYN